MTKTRSKTRFLMDLKRKSEKLIKLSMILSWAFRP